METQAVGVGSDLAGLVLLPFVRLVSLAIYVLVPIGFFFEGPVGEIDTGCVKAVDGLRQGSRVATPSS